PYSDRLLAAMTAARRLALAAVLLVAGAAAAQPACGEGGETLQRVERLGAALDGAEAPARDAALLEARSLARELSLAPHTTPAQDVLTAVLDGLCPRLVRLLADRRRRSARRPRARLGIWQRGL